MAYSRTACGRRVHAANLKTSPFSNYQICSIVLRLTPHTGSTILACRTVVEPVGRELAGSVDIAILRPQQIPWRFLVQHSSSAFGLPKIDPPLRPFRNPIAARCLRFSNYCGTLRFIYFRWNNMQRVHLILGIFLVFVFTSCAKEIEDSSQSKNAESNKSSANSPIDQSTSASGDSSNIVRLKNNNEIEFRGETIDGRRGASALLVKKVADANRRVDLATELSIAVDESSTVGFLQQVVLGLQIARFEHLYLLSEGTRTRIPVAAAHNSESGLNLVTMKLVSSSRWELVRDYRRGHR